MKRVIAMSLKFDHKAFGLDVRVHAKRLNLSYADIDRLAGIAAGNTSRFAGCKEANPKIKTLIALCNALDLNPQHYFVFADER